MPRFSVILPAYKVQAYPQESLDSVLTQSYPDLELIAVDDASPDASGSIIDEYAARAPRVTAVHLAHNLGPGPARNAGPARANGDYLVFLLRSCPPGAIARTEDELVDISSTGHWQGSRSAQLRAAFRARFCSYDDGHAAERVVRRVFLGQTAPVPAVVPLADRRPTPAAPAPAPSPALAPVRP
ncbi:glycosyltransferase family 2 protein [Streptomyces sp. NPDC085540]|uniref:glycosyltransferase family 2 protein n=1 Tax=Streptomyces sp. NPDC085540 TaxID=3365730 RepID=UPI0037D97F59